MTSQLVLLIDLTSDSAMIKLSGSVAPSTQFQCSCCVYPSLFLSFFLSLSLLKASPPVLPRGRALQGSGIDRVTGTTNELTYADVRDGDRGRRHRPQSGLRRACAVCQPLEELRPRRLLQLVVKRDALVQLH